MTLLPEIRGQLLDAAFGAPGRSAASPRGRWSGRLAIAVSIVAAVAVAAVALLSLHGSSAPPPAPATGPVGPPPSAWLTAMRRAVQSTDQRDPACRLAVEGARPRVHDQRFLTTAPPRSITAILPSLASPARGALRVTVSELRALRIDANGIYVRYAWQGRTDGIRYYVVPAEVVGTTKMLPAPCYQQELAAFRNEARRFPASQRAAAITFAQQRLSPGAAAGVSIVTVGWGGHGESNWVLADGKTGPGLDVGGEGSKNSTTTHLLVTDRVASVTATYPAQSHPGRVPRTFSVTKQPVRNLVIFVLAGAWDPPQLTFRSRTGAVIARTRHR